MKVKVPAYAKDVKDEGMLVLLGFMVRISDKHGYDSWYDMSMSDAYLISNCHIKGFFSTVAKWPCIQENARFTYFEDTNELRWTLAKPKRAGNFRTGMSNMYAEVEINEHRSQLIWMYLLGITAKHIVYEADEIEPIDGFRLNATGISEIRVNRKADYLIKQEMPKQKRGRKPFKRVDESEA